MLLIWGLRHTRYMLHQWATTSLSQGSFSVSESQFPFSFQKYRMRNLKHSDFQNICKATIVHSQIYLPNTQQNNVQISICDTVVCKREIVQCNSIFVRPLGTLLGKVLLIQCPSLTQCMGPPFFSPISGYSLFLKLWCLISPFSIMSHFLWKSCLLVTSFWPSQVKYDLLAGLVNCHYTIGFDRLLSRRICFICLCRINLTKEITQIFLFTDSWGP